jgi:hypothetical protein
MFNKFTDFYLKLLDLVLNLLKLKLGFLDMLLPEGVQEVANRRLSILEVDHLADHARHLVENNSVVLAAKLFSKSLPASHSARQLHLLDPGLQVVYFERNVVCAVALD